MRKLLILLSLFLPSLAFANDALSVTVRYLGPMENGEVSIYTAVIHNNSTQSQEFFLWTCSDYFNWVSDNKSVSIKDWPCPNNESIKKKLTPGEKLEQTIWLKVKDNRSKTLSFRLGFTPRRMDKEGRIAPVWSKLSSAQDDWTDSPRGCRF